MMHEVKTYNADGYDCSFAGGPEVFVKLEDYQKLERIVKEQYTIWIEGWEAAASKFDKLLYGPKTNGIQTKYFRDKRLNPYRKKIEMSDYGPGPHVAVDAVVICNREWILLIQRRDNGEWALPGGFVDPTDDSLMDAAFRELKEETGFDIDQYHHASVRTLRPKTFKKRDPRSWVISHPFCINIGIVDGTLPRVHGSDDAKHAQWVHIDNYKVYIKNQMFLDHADIVTEAIYG